MSGLQDIAIVTAPRLLEDDTPAIRALITELQQHVETLNGQGKSTSIDLLALLSEPERQRLRELLGEGELHARLDAFGPSLIQETAVPGIWFIEHRNAQDEPIAELLMVTRCPDILSTPTESLSDSPALLANLLQEEEGL